MRKDAQTYWHKLKGNFFLTNSGAISCEDCLEQGKKMGECETKIFAKNKCSGYGIRWCLLTLDSGSGIRFFRIPDLNSQTDIFDKINDNFFGKKYYNSWCLYYLFKNKIIYFLKFVATKNGWTKNSFSPPFLVLLLDPGSVMDKIKNQDPGDNHPGSASHC
jgi:hypothetical protein